MRLRSADISARTIGDETIVLNLPSSRYLAITGVGTRLFELLVEDRSLDELVGAIVDEYEVDPLRAARPDVVLTWDIADEVISQLEVDGGWGAEYLIPMPAPHVVRG